MFTIFINLEHEVSCCVASSAEFSELWRPQLHVVGSIAFGYTEAYWIMNSDQAKDANMECTIISKMLDLVWDEVQAGGFALPRALVIAADNTTREAKNHFVQTYLGYLKAAKKFEAAECEYQATGHTHNE